MATRSASGEFAHFGAIENEHRNHILDLSVAPARISPKIASEAAELARTALETLDVVGTMCVEFFLSRDGKLLINEVAPRPHNSGHLTIEAAVTSQFEQHIRAICGMPLGDTDLPKPAAMANLLGDLWADGEPDWSAALAYSSVKLHLYGKRDARPGRKMGHLTATASDSETAVDIVMAARRALTSAGTSSFAAQNESRESVSPVLCN